MKKTAALYLCLLCLLTIYQSCEDRGGVIQPLPPSSQTDTIRFVPSETTRFPPQLGNLTRTLVSPANIVLEYASTAPQYSVGQIIVDTVGQGYLRRITSVQQSGRTVTLSTTDAKFNQAFRDVHISKLIQVTPTPQNLFLQRMAPVSLDTSYRINLDGRSHLASFKARKIMPIGGIVLNSRSYNFAWVLTDISLTISDDASNLAFSLSVDSLTLGMNIGIDFKLDMSEFELRRLRFVKIEDQGFELRNIKLKGERTISSKEVKITPISVPALAVIPVGWLVFTIGFNVDLGVDAALTVSATAALNSVAEYNNHTELGGDWSNGTWSQVDTRNVDASGSISGSQASGAISIDAEYYIEPSVDISLYGLIGPQFYLKPGFVSRISYPPPNCGVDFAVDGGVKLALSLFDLPLLEFSVPLYNQNLWQGCGAISIPSTPQLVSPADGSTGMSLTPVLRWNSAFGASSYRLQVSRSLAFSPNLLDRDTVTPTQFSIPTGMLTELTRYYWRVNAQNSSGISDWSPSWNFTTGGGQMPNALAYYPFNGNANDESGNGHNGSVHGAVSANDRFGNLSRAYSFNGTSAYIDVSKFSQLPQASSTRTVSAWVKSAPYFSDNQVIFDWGSPYLRQRFCVLIYKTDNKNFFSSYADDLWGKTNLADNRWHHVVCTYDGVNVRMYVDGVFDISKSIPLNTQGDYLSIGRRGLGDSYIEYMKGSIDDIRIYDRVLSDFEIQQLYNER